LAWRLFLVVALLAAIASFGYARAAEPVPTDNQTCFCLRHTASGAVATGCHASKGRNDAYATATCWDEQAKKTGEAFTVDNRWSLIKADEDRCLPCERRPPPSRYEIPRKGE
jgi:hypothetical protein